MTVPSSTPQDVVDLILQFARENPTWGYDWIADALANIGHQVIGQNSTQHLCRPCNRRRVYPVVGCVKSAPEKRTMSSPT
jgi:hypothetical protein